MIEVTAKLLHGHVFLSGETVECSISFSHPPLASHRVSQSHTDVFESLAWAAAQIHCQCFTDSKIQKDTERSNLQPTFADTTLGASTHELGQIEIATKPKILFCDLRLSPGQTKTYIYREKVPADSPPSYRGQLVKYSYKIIIGTQRVNSPVKILRVPIRVLPLCEVSLNDGALCNETTEELAPANPFLEIRQKETSLDISLQTLQMVDGSPNKCILETKPTLPEHICLKKLETYLEFGGNYCQFIEPKRAISVFEREVDLRSTKIPYHFVSMHFGSTFNLIHCLSLFTFSSLNITARRNPNFYMISNTWGKVARFCLFKPAYKLGEDIIGTFDFTVATVNCVQVSVSLQCEEETVIDINKEKSKQVRIITFSKHHEVCLGYKYTQLILPIPLHVTPAFSTRLVTLKWRLHFEFVTSTSKDLEPPGLDQNGWQAPSEIPIETMVWSLPIRLYSTTPTHVAQGVQSNNVYKLVIR